MRVRTCVLVIVLASVPAHADERISEEQEARSGDFLPFSRNPSPSPSFVTAIGGYDTARAGAMMLTQLQARLNRRLYLIVSGTYEGPTDSTLEPSVEGELIFLEEPAHGLDLAVQGGWEHQGLSTVADVLGRVAIGKHIAGAYVMTSASIGIGASNNERYGELTLGGVGEVLPELAAGVDSRGRIDLQHEGDSDTELSWDIQAGPVATHSAGPVAITALAGVSAFQLHGAQTDVGAITMLGAGTTF